MKMNTFFNKGVFAASLLALGACGDDEGNAKVPDAYEFSSRYGAGSSVSYSGQIARHVIISDLATFLGRADAAIQAGGGDLSAVPFIDASAIEGGCESEFLAAMDRYFRAGVGEVPWLDDEPMLLTTDPPRLPSQVTYGDLSTQKNLFDKIAGNDTSTDAVDWSSNLANVVELDVGAGPVRASSPVQLVDLIVQKTAQLACAALELGASEGPFFVDENGIDLQQLLQKFLLGSVAFAQGADDYLDDDVAGKGLLSPNARDGESPYTTLEHHWDEGFGYYGAARHTLDMGVDTIASTGHQDADGDGSIDLLGEKSFGASTNAAKRDRGACVPTSISDDAMRAFIAGRHLITSAGEELTAEELDELKAHRDAAVGAWERAIAASAVHYVNECLADLTALEAADGSYSLPTHGKHWSELAGFLMSLQFNPHSQWLVRGVSPSEEFLGLLQLAGPAPRTDAAARGDLVALRDALGQAYGFALENVEGDGSDCAGW